LGFSGGAVPLSDVKKFLECRKTRTEECAKFWHPVMQRACRFLEIDRGATMNEIVKDAAELCRGCRSYAARS
jgi:hypothetical protein